MHRWNGTIPGDVWVADDQTALVRFAHRYGVGEGADLAKPVTFDLAGLFNPNVTALKKWVQVSLTANQPATNVKPWQWRLDGGGSLPEASAEERQTPNAPSITLQPMEIQTWIVQYGAPTGAVARGVKRGVDA